MRRSPICGVPLFIILAAACTPYAVTTTARPLARGERMRTTTLTVVPGGAQWSSDTSGRENESIVIPGLDVEQRYGLDDRADLGVRVTSASGVIASYKRRLDGPTAQDTRATALIIGAGLVNFAQHAHGDITLITSGRESASMVPYGGIRALQVLPLSSVAVSDRPTVGAFSGIRWGGRSGGFSAELGVFYDRSALKLRRNQFIVVPSFAMHGAVLRRLLPK